MMRGPGRAMRARPGLPLEDRLLRGLFKPAAESQARPFAHEALALAGVGGGRIERTRKTRILSRNVPFEPTILYPATRSCRCRVESVLCSIISGSPRE